MASVTQTPGVAPHLLSPIANQGIVEQSSQTSHNPKPRDVTTTFHYYKDPVDGSPPPPTYVSDPSTYERVPLSEQAIVHDIRGSADEYTLDTAGFQIVNHVSAEKDFWDDEQIKQTYYPETEELLKKA